MASVFFSELTLDDLLRTVIESVLDSGKAIRPSKGPALELTGVLLELTDPRARLSRTEARGKAFSCLGELCWYLAGSDQLEFIEHYIPAYREFASDGIVPGAYGPRLLGDDEDAQVQTVIRRLIDHPDSRRAVVQLFDRRDLWSGADNPPCTCTLQFLRRNGYLHLVVNMRSNDAILGLPHDVFCFTMLQSHQRFDLGQKQRLRI